ncbi:protein YAE1 homolog isoform X2 [Symphalangus syndactylus]|uniref:protein YAE1 homolog isoform X2 n=1 Tax=Symphalangus syndactylus TaxID=9590 RepID=UPI0024433424|nr:protein YAE1 homolog isoform X2 [Symphalangus syndactylus]
MSWVQAASLIQGPGDKGDVFDEEADESLLAQREWQSHMQRRVKEGYRDGIDAGKAVTLQQGFNQGYKEGAEVILNYGRLRGTLRKSTDWSLLGLRAPLRSPEEVETQLRPCPLPVPGHMESRATLKQPTELEATLLSLVPQSGRATPRFPARLRAPFPGTQSHRCRFRRRPNRDPAAACPAWPPEAPSNSEAHFSTYNRIIIRGGHI